MEKFLPPEITLFACYDRKTAFISEKCVYDCYVLIAVKSGCLQYQAEDGSTYTAKENCLVILPPNIPIFQSVLEPAAFIMAKINVTIDIPFPQTPLVVENIPRIAEDISALSQNGFAFTHNPDAKTIHYILDLWYLAAQSIQRQSAPLQSAYHYLCEHFCEDISIQDLAKSYGYTPPRFIAIFNKHFGAPPKNIILQKRISKAQQLLLQSDLSVSEISLACGFEDALYFSRIFSKYCGASPSQFRKNESI